ATIRTVSSRRALAAAAAMVDQRGPSHSSSRFPAEIPRTLLPTNRSRSASVEMAAAAAAVVQSQLQTPERSSRAVVIHTASSRKASAVVVASAAVHTRVLILKVLNWFKNLSVPSPVILPLS